MYGEIFLRIEDYLTYCKARGLSTKTIKSYCQCLELFERYCRDRNITSMAQITQKTIVDYVNFLQERGKYTVTANDFSKVHNCPQNRNDVGKKVSNVTINGYIRDIKAFFNYCESYHIIKKNPVKNIKQLPSKRKAKDFITDEQFSRLLKCFNICSYAEYRDYIITNILIDTGMRISECLLIKIEDIDFNKRMIYLPGENTKSKRGRAVFYSPQMQTLLRHWLKFRDIYTSTDYLFSKQNGDPIEARVYRHNFTKYCSRVDLKNVSPHTLRNNFAKRFLMNGGNIYTLSQILGHSSIKVTENAYLDLTDEDLMQGYQAFSPLANMKKY